MGDGDEGARVARDDAGLCAVAELRRNSSVSRTRKPPWIIKPRSDVSAIGIKKVYEPAEVWQAIDDLDSRERFRERAAHHLLARFVAGDVFHVDSVVSKGRVIFAGVNQYGRPPMEVAHGGGAYISHSVLRGSADEKALLAANRKLIRALGLDHGATHAEFIKSDEDGQFYFLEIAARVGGASYADVLEAASGVNLWREWAKLEVACKFIAQDHTGAKRIRGDYSVPGETGVTRYFGL